MAIITSYEKVIDKHLARLQQLVASEVSKSATEAGSNKLYFENAISRFKQSYMEAEEKAPYIDFIVSLNSYGNLPEFVFQVFVKAYDLDTHLLKDSLQKLAKLLTDPNTRAALRTFQQLPKGLSYQILSAPIIEASYDPLTFTSVIVGAAAGFEIGEVDGEFTSIIPSGSSEMLTTDATYSKWMNDMRKVMSSEAFSNLISNLVFDEKTPFGNLQVLRYLIGFGSLEAVVKLDKMLAAVNYDSGVLDILGTTNALGELLSAFAKQNDGLAEASRD